MSLFDIFRAKNGYFTITKYVKKAYYLLNFNFFLSWRDSPLVGLGLLLIHEDFCGF